jgi:periplasmic protein CpxP/Spy
MNSIATPPAWRIVALGLAVSIAGAVGVVNLASAHDADGTAPSRVGGHGPMGGMHAGGAIFPLAGPMLERMLDDVGATAEQRDRLHQIAGAAQADLKAPTEAARADREKMALLFVQPTVDAKAVEALRRKMLAHHDAVTKRMNAAMLEAAQVLTVEQRQQMAERMKRHAERTAHQPPELPRS